MNRKQRRKEQRKKPRKEPRPIREQQNEIFEVTTGCFLLSMRDTFGIDKQEDYEKFFERYNELMNMYLKQRKTIHKDIVAVIKEEFFGLDLRRI